FLAGTLPRAPRPRPAPRPVVEGGADRVRAVRRAPAIPPGPVLIEYGMRAYDLDLGRLLDDPEMRDFLAAVPQAGRLLRPLWRRLTTEELPEILRLPPRPRRARTRPVATSGPPELRRVRLSDGTTSWEPITCYRFLSPSPPRQTRAHRVEPPEPAPAPPEPPRPPRDSRWMDRLFTRRR